MKFKFLSWMIVGGTLLAAGIALLVVGISDQAELAKPPAKLDTLTASDLYVGRYVEGTIYEVWDEFASTSEYDETLGIKHNERTTDRYFAMVLPGEDFKFAAVCSRDNNEIETFYKMGGEANAFYLDGEDVENPTTLKFRGKVQKLSGDYLKFFKEYISYQMDIPESETGEYIAPFVIRSYPNDTAGMFIGVGIAAIVLGGLIMAFRIIRKIVSGR